MFNGSSKFVHSSIMEMQKTTYGVVMREVATSLVVELSRWYDGR